jgi:pantoate--beta-alanine ligase
MNLARTTEDLDQSLDSARAHKSIIGFVPTMGALHDGHLSLVRAARADCDVVVASIFVNPLQFGPNEDFAAYPRDEERDLERLAEAHVDVVFMPSVEAMYPSGASTTIAVGPIGDVLEGEHRPGHFTGVCTVVAKLFHIVKPRSAYFGQKDAQQVAAIKKMVADLDFGIEIVVAPTVREPDGLAMSSRNAYLSKEERGRATALYGALQAGRSALEGGADIAGAEIEMRKILEEEEGVEPDYARVVDPDTFEEPKRSRKLLAIAARVGPARLIDNLLWEGPHDADHA